MSPRRRPEPPAPIAHTERWFLENAEGLTLEGRRPTWIRFPEPPPPWQQRAIDAGAMRLCELTPDCPAIPARDHYHYVTEEERKDRST